LVFGHYLFRLVSFNTEQFVYDQISQLPSSVDLKSKPTLLGASQSVVNDFQLKFHLVLII